MRRIIFACIVLAGLFLGYSVWRAFGASELVRLKEAVTLNVDGRAVSGVSVNTVQCVAPIPFAYMSCGGSNPIDPIVINIGRYGYLYAADLSGVSVVPDLLAEKQLIIARRYRTANNRIETHNYAISHLMDKDISVCISPSTSWSNGIQFRCLTLFRFTNMSDAKTIEIVDPINLPADLRDHVALSSMTVGFTSLPATHANLALAPWNNNNSGPQSLSLFGLIRMAKQDHGPRSLR